MKVALISHLFPSASDPVRGPFVAEQAHAIAARADVHVISGVYGSRSESATYDGIDVRYTRLPWLHGIPSQLALGASSIVYGFQAWRWLRDPSRRPDIIHAHYGFPDGFVGRRVARRFGVPCVVTLHGDDANVQMHMPVVGPLLASELAMADAVICVSERMRTELAECYPTLGKVLVTVPNGYDARDVTFEPHEPAEYFLFVGTLLPVKNPDLLVRAFAQIADKTDLDLAIVGEGPLEETVRSLAAMFGITDRIRFLGRLEHTDVVAALRRAKALVLPSRHEGMPIVAIEALATGTPVVATTVGGLPELVNDDRLGILVRPNEVDPLSRALLTAATRDWDEREIAANAPILSWDENACIVSELYERTIADHSPVRAWWRFGRRAGAAAGAGVEGEDALATVPEPGAEVAVASAEATRGHVAYLSLQSTVEGQAAYAHVHGIIEGLSAQGWHVALYEPTYGTDRPTVLQRLGQFLRVQHRLIPALDDVDVVYCRAHFACLPTALAARHRGIPVVHEVNGTWEDLFLAWPWTRYLAPLFIGMSRLQWRMAAGLVAVTSDLAEWAERQSSGTTTVTIPNAADIDVFRPEGRKASDVPKPYAIFFGALAPWQGIPTLLQALASPAWPEGVRALVVGDGSEHGAVEEAVRDGLPITYLGRMAYRELPAYIRGALVGISPQNAGGGRSATGLSPLKVFETLACDVPVVVSDYPGQAQLVRGLHCGLVVPPEDPDALAVAVAKLAEDPKSAHRMGKRGGRAVRRWHSWGARGAETDELLRQVVLSRKERRPMASARPRFEGDE